jgi:hypothetical protein
MTDENMTEEETQFEEVQKIVREVIAEWARQYLAPVVINGMAREITAKLSEAELL